MFFFVLSAQNLTIYSHWGFDPFTTWASIEYHYSVICPRMAHKSTFSALFQCVLQSVDYARWCCLLQDRAFAHRALLLWNRLPLQVWEVGSHIIKCRLKIHLFSIYHNLSSFAAAGMPSKGCYVTTSDPRLYNLTEHNTVIYYSVIYLCVICFCVMMSMSCNHILCTVSSVVVQHYKNKCSDLHL